MNYSIVFSDIDGTLLNEDHQLLPGTLKSILQLKEKGIPFVIVSARGPMGIYPILESNHFNCPIICYSGSLIIDENRKKLLSVGFDKELAKQITTYLESSGFDCVWNVYSEDLWIAQDTKDPRVIRESNAVKACPFDEGFSAIKEGSPVSKILVIVNPNCILELEEELKKHFPELSIVKSSNILIEIMGPGITKRTAVIEACKVWNIDVSSSVAFGDNYNDVEMLETVAHPYLMDNAPEALKKRFPNITDSCNDEGIYRALQKLGIVE